MTGREKIEAALSPRGSPQSPAVICYEALCYRDHWEQSTDCPWWFAQADLPRQMQWRRQAIRRTGQDWFVLPAGLPRAQIESLTFEQRGSEVFVVDVHTGQSRQLHRPQVGGWSGEQVHSLHPERLLDSREQIDQQIPLPEDWDPAAPARDGRNDLASAMLGEFGGELYPFRHVNAPLWRCYTLWGFEGMMTMIAERPELVAYACQRFLDQAVRGVREAALAGARGIWIEDCLADMVGPKDFARLETEPLRELVRHIRAAGLHSIHYFCGNPAGKWRLLLDIGADALGLEESKKGFEIDIEQVVRQVDGRCAVLGNLDAVGLLQDGTEEPLRREIARQLAAGRRNAGRFIMSLGSPVTPATPMTRVRRYCELVRELGG